MTRLGRLGILYIGYQLTDLVTIIRVPNSIRNNVVIGYRNLVLRSEKGTAIS